MYKCRIQNVGGFDNESLTVTGKDVMCTLITFHLDTKFTSIFLVIPKFRFFGVLAKHCNS